MSTYVATTTSTTATNSGGYTTYTPFINAATTSPLYVSFEGTEEKMKQYAEKVDKHVDQLEEDIEYFNKSLEEHQAHIELHSNEIHANLTTNIEQDKKIKALEDSVEFLKNYTNYLEGRIMSLEDKLNDKKVCEEANSN